MTAEELAEQSGLDLQSVRDLEAGVIVDKVRRLNCVFRVAKATKAHPGKVLGAPRLVRFSNEIEDQIAVFERSRGLV